MKPLVIEGSKIRRKSCAASAHISIHEDEYDIF